MSEQKEKKSGWYPGKFIQKATDKRKSKRDSVPGSSADSGATAGGSDVARGESGNDSYSSIAHDTILPTAMSAAAADPSGAPVTVKAAGGAAAAQSVIGGIRIRIPVAKYMKIKEAKITVELEGVSASVDVDEHTGKVDFDKFFELSSLNSDIIVTIAGKSSLLDNLPGNVIIPVTSFLTFGGSIASAKEQWYQIFPPYMTTATGKSKQKMKKYMSGFADYPGYALTKPKDSIGFLQISGGMKLTDGGAFQHYIMPSVNTKKKNDVLVDIFGPQLDANDTLSLAIFNQNTKRWRRLLVAPSCVSSFTEAPENLILIAMFGFLSLSLSVWQLPVFAVFVVGFNGILSMTGRTYKHLQVWNDIVTYATTEKTRNASVDEEGDDGEDDSSALGDGQSILNGTAKNNNTLSQALNTAQQAPPTSYNRLHCTACYTNHGWFLVAFANLNNYTHCAEIITNAFNFADSRCTIIALGVLFGLALLATIFLVIFPARFFVFIVGTTFLSVTSLREYVQLSRLPESAQLKVQALQGMWDQYWCMVPDELEMNHRHICSLQLTKETAAEMLEAAAEEEATKTSKKNH